MLNEFFICLFWASLIAKSVKNLPAVQETQVQSLGREDPLEKEMATHSSILGWRIPSTEKSGGLQSMGSQESDMSQRLNQQQASFSHIQINACQTENLLGFCLLFRFNLLEKYHSSGSYGNQEKEMIWRLKQILIKVFHWIRSLVFRCSGIGILQFKQGTLIYSILQWQPTPVLLPGKSHWWGSLVGCSLWGRTESDTTEVIQQQQQQ